MGNVEVEGGDCRHEVFFVVAGNKNQPLLSFFRPKQILLERVLHLPCIRCDHPRGRIWDSSIHFQSPRLPALSSVGSAGYADT